MGIRESGWILEYASRRVAHGSPSFESNLIDGSRTWVRRYGRLLPALPLIDRAIVRPHRSRSDALRVGFLAVRFSGLAAALQDLGERSILLAGNPREYRHARSASIPSVSLFAATGALHRATAVNDANREAHLEQAVASVRKTLMAVSLDVIIVPNDSLPLPRAVLTAAHSLGVPVVCVQDGAYLSTDHPDDLHGYASDAMLLWGDYCLGLYNPARHANLSVFGYPNPIRRLGLGRRSGPGTHGTVCFVGQPFEAYDDALEQPKLELIRNAIEGVKAAGLTLVYRPHQGEDARMLSKIRGLARVTPRSESLAMAFATHQAFVGINSTVLIEAGLHGNQALQLRHDAFGGLDFATIGASASVDGRQIGEIEQRLRGAGRSDGSDYPRPSFVRVHPRPEVAFRAWLREFTA